MHIRFKEPVLNKPIDQLKLGKQFLLICEVAGFYSLGYLLEVHTSELLNLPGFNYHILGEYIDFLESQNLGHYIDVE